MKNIEVKTKRLTLRPMSDGCKRNPANRVWYAPWKMTLKGSLESIGDLCFKGPVKNHAVEIGYGVQPEQEGRGYATEALRQQRHPHA